MEATSIFPKLQSQNAYTSMQHSVENTNNQSHLQNIS